MRKPLILAAALTSAVPLSSAANAVTLVVAGGELIGANGVNVDGTLFDVRFVEGTCAEVFGGCDDPSDFRFSFTSSGLAAVDLLDQVFIDSPAGQFDSIPSQTLGCSLDPCFAAVPFQAGLGFFSFWGAGNFSNPALDDYIGLGPLPSSFGTEFNDAFVFARFEPAALNSAVPEPATWAMMLLGFGLIGAAVRSAMRTQKLATSYS